MQNLSHGFRANSQLDVFIKELSMCFTQHKCFTKLINIMAATSIAIGNTFFNIIHISIDKIFTEYRKQPLYFVVNTKF